MARVKVKPISGQDIWTLLHLVSQINLNEKLYLSHIMKNPVFHKRRGTEIDKLKTIDSNSSLYRQYRVMVLALCRLSKWIVL